ncbi:G-type lectin S-receptor-like serine/threonine-protein kinase [Panicum miliaceum]|uniref:G-type lectin S-receptor-like serine/threonine-protein kinase n=1 Tax=Panicum miliaceum TaxID=4540 RepID=A0A3L6R1Z2_PANMI|nr:G-type lectin S-receptor-like serine/threonine-protein kinase [Panicum miliaceum]
MYVLLSRRKRLKKMANQNGSSLQVYSYGELRGAERLCGGGFGAVYRGVVTGHTERVLWLSRNAGAHPGRQTRPDRRILLAPPAAARRCSLVYEYMPFRNPQF